MSRARAGGIQGEGLLGQDHPQKFPPVSKQTLHLQTLCFFLSVILTKLLLNLLTNSASALVLNPLIMSKIGRSALEMLQ